MNGSRAKVVPFHRIEMRFHTGSLLALFTLSCAEHSASDVNNTGLPLHSGAYRFYVAGVDGRYQDGTIIPVCPGIGPAGGLGEVGTMVDLTLDGNVWRVRPHTSAGGAFDIALTPGPIGAGFNGPTGVAVGIQGTASGMVANTISPLSVEQPPLSGYGLRLGGGSLGATTSFTGGIETSGALANGYIFGDVTFTYPGGASINCVSGTATWSLSPVLP